MSGRSYFGTDGVRGKAGEFPITAHFALQLGTAVGETLRAAAEHTPLVMLGMDTRASGPMLAHALAAGLTSRGVDVGWLGVIPTPGVSFLTRDYGAHAGIVVSASHNPYTDNGIKIFNAIGEKLSDETELRLESLLEQLLTGEHLPPIAPNALGQVHDASAEIQIYEQHLLSHAPELAGLRMLVDCAHGAAAEIAPRVFSRLGGQVEFINTEPNGVNINHQCGSTYPTALSERVVAGGFDVGITFDGDADRALLVDSRGRLVSGDHMMVIHSLAHGLQQIVGTVMTNLGIEHYLREQGVSLLRSDVGDRYVFELLSEHSLTFGGEQSGHLLFLDKAPSGDGMLSALLTLAALQRSGRPLSAWMDEIPEYPQVLTNVRVAPQKKHEIGRHEAVLAAVSRAEQMLAGAGRVLLRPSGTEPLIRVMVEGKEAAMVQSTAADIANVVKEISAS